MNAKQIISRVAVLGLAGALAVGCLSSQREMGAPLLLTARATLAAEAARVVRVIDADTYIMLSDSTTYRLRLLGVDAPEKDQAFGPQAADSVATAGRAVPCRWIRCSWFEAGPGPLTRTDWYWTGRRSRWPRNGPGAGCGSAA